jgi:hypothetical protein
MRKIMVASVLVLVVLSLAGYCLAQAAKATTQPASDILHQILKEAQDARLYAYWACILAGLALAGVVWIAWSMQALARNQVALAKLVQQKG